MARPAARRRRSRDEDDDGGGGSGRGPRRGRGGGAPQGNPMTLVMGGVVVLLIIVVAVAALNSGDVKAKKAQPLGPARATAPPSGPRGPVLEPPKPLTPEELSEVEAVFAEAAKEMETFRGFVKAGWKKKEAGDNDGANDEWVQAKKHYQKALGITNEVMEDEDRFPVERQQAHMKRFLDRLGGWAKEMADVPKVNVR